MPTILPIAAGLLAAALASAPLLAATPVPAYREPHHHVALDNAYVRTLEVRLAPGEATDYHVHSIPSVVVELSQARTASQVWGREPGRIGAAPPGDTRYAAYDEHRLVHRVANRGDTVFHVMDIELMQPNRLPADGYPPEPPSPAKLLFKEKQVRAYRVALEPGESLRLPASKAAHLVVAYRGRLENTAAQSAPRTENAGEEWFAGPRLAVTLRNPGAGRAEAVVLELETTAADR